MSFSENYPSDEKDGQKIDGPKKHPAQRKLKRCYNCGDGLHLSFECDKPKTWNACYNCLEVGHKSNECTKERREKKCYFCGNLGHIAAVCPDRQKPTKSSS